MIKKVKKNSTIIYEDDNVTIINCPVCGTLVDTDDICSECKWQNTGIINVDGGPNKMTIEEARIAYSVGKPIS